MMLSKLPTSDCLGDWRNEKIPTHPLTSRYGSRDMACAVSTCRQLGFAYFQDLVDLVYSLTVQSYVTSGGK